MSENNYGYGVQDAIPWFLTGGAGMVGRLMYHAKLVQLGQRKPFGWALFWDIPIAVGMGWIAMGLSKFSGLPWEMTISASMAASYLGPYSIDMAFARWLDKKLAKEATNVTD